ncbi:MAG: FAD-dependent oxidoreductase [bacterium]
MNQAANYEIVLIKCVHLEKEYYYFDFTKPEGFAFTEGQFGLFGILGREIEGRKLRAFSIVSTNGDPFIRVATRIVASPSDFKRCLLELNPGDRVSMKAPLGEFILDASRLAVFIAGGIGITPIRSMLFSNLRNVGRRNDVLIYSELEANYPFREELEKLSGLETLFAADIEPTQKVIIQTVEKRQNDAVYYLSGSPGFIRSITALLEAHGIQSESIRFDVFVGY